MGKFVRLTISFILFILFLLPIQDYKDCYDFYNWECEECHKQNKSYGLCSGFCYESNGVSEGCEFDLDKICNETIPHNYCVSESFRWR